VKIAHFFIDRPVFAIVISIVAIIAGAIAMFTLPIAQYPQIAPPTVTVSATYPGANADFTLYSDDGTTYAYEQGNRSITNLHWDNASRELTHTGAAAWTAPDQDLLEIIASRTAQ